MKARPAKPKIQPQQREEGPRTQSAPLKSIFPLAAGVFLGLALLKFGNPPIMEKWVEAPTNIYEFIFGSPWPLHWAYWMLAAVALAGIASWKWRSMVPLAILILPAAWLLLQFVAAGHSVDSALTRATVPHLAACAGCFYIGAFALWRAPRMGLFWVGLFAGFTLLVISAWSQRFGGLEETRKYFWTYVYPTMSAYPTDYVRKITSSRVFGTLFYPNTLAAGIILLFPPLSAVLWRWTGGGRFTAAARSFILIVWTMGSMATLLWSGSKGGWLVMMAVGLIAFFRWPGVAPKTRILTAVILMAIGLGGFFWTYSAFFKRGAPSVGARFDYWKAAVENTRLKPLYGSGPGTFAVPYAELKAQESEMSRLVHNDYLQQASDSGAPGFLCYAAFVVAALWWGMKTTRLRQYAGIWDAPELVPFAVWLGLAGWFLHSSIEFNLYIPALAWAAFLLLGWLLGAGSSSANTDPGAQSQSNV